MTERMMSGSTSLPMTSGFDMKAYQDVYSSDSTPFADAGIPAVSFARWAASGTGVIHSNRDVIEHISERILGEDTAYICKVVEDLANAYMVPVKREMPQNMKDEIDNLLSEINKKGEGFNFSNDFIFDNQMILEAFKLGYDIEEVYCPARYLNSSSSINFTRSLKYGFGVVCNTFKYFFK